MNPAAPSPSDSSIAQSFRKKPVVIQAKQWFKDGDHPAVTMRCDGDRFVPWCPTLEDGHVVTPGDWIITGVKGEHYPCKPDIFEMTYESASAPAAAVGGAVENIAEDAYWAIAEHLGTPSGWSVQEHVCEIRELLQEAMFAFGRMGANSDLKHPQRDLWERINASLQGIVHEPRRY